MAALIPFNDGGRRQAETNGMNPPDPDRPASIDCTHVGPVAVITFSHPPVNALSVGAGVIDALADSIGAAIADPAVGALVVMAAGDLFSAGADIADFGASANKLDRMRALTSDLIEAAHKPIVMALHGMALGGGLEFALSGHYRICAPGTKLGLPEVTLGLLPGAGGTQRLPRLIGVEAALQMMLSGTPLDASKALALGLIDRVATGDFRAEAAAWAKELVAAGPKRACDRLPAGDPAPAIDQARRGLDARSLSQAPAFIIDCVEAACTRPFAEGLALEKRLFESLIDSEASLGLRHVFFGRREVARIPGPKTSAAGVIHSVAVIGGGLMGTGIAIALLNSELKVTLIEPRAEALDKAVATIRKTIQRDVDKGRLSAAAAAHRIDSLFPSATLEACAAADLIIEAVYESMDVKRQVFVELDRIASPAAILASNTSTLDLDVIAACTRRPERVVGLHFFSPANIMKLLEIVRGRRTDPGVLAASMAFSKAIGKVGVVSGVCDGFIGNRMFEEYLRQAYFLLEEGALPAQIDGALENWGMAMGPLKVMDLAGQDIGWSIRKRRAIEQPGRPYSTIPDQLCEMGRFGQKTGAGFYLYPDGRTAREDPQISALILAHSAKLGITRRAVADAQIVDRCVLALVNEGARIVEEGIAYRAVDVDMVSVFGYGFPAARGGPMFYAARMGFANVVRRIEEFAAGRNGWAWVPAALLRSNP